MDDCPWFRNGHKSLFLIWNSENQWQFPTHKFFFQGEPEYSHELPEFPPVRRLIER